MSGKLLHFIEDVLEGDYRDMFLAVPPVHDDDFIAPDFGEGFFTAAIAFNLKERSIANICAVHLFHHQSPPPDFD